MLNTLVRSQLRGEQAKLFWNCRLSCGLVGQEVHQVLWAWLMAGVFLYPGLQACELFRCQSACCLLIVKQAAADSGK